MARTSRALAGALVAAAATLAAPAARADKPADDFLNPQEPGPRLAITSFLPGFRTTYDHRFELEPQMSELRTQLMGTVAYPFSEVSANVDVRLFLLTFGASAGYHYEWRLHQFTPNEDGVDTAGIREPVPDHRQYENLTRDARRDKDENADYQQVGWRFTEARLGFLWPAQNFMGVSTAALRHSERPDRSFDWQTGTVYNGGFHLRWENMALFRDPNIGFIGPALRVMNLPRTARRRDHQFPPEGPCRSTPDCRERRDWEFHYGFVAGTTPNWVGTSDAILMQFYTTAGMDNDLFGVHFFPVPVQVLVAYQLEVEL